MSYFEINLRLTESTRDPRSMSHLYRPQISRGDPTGNTYMDLQPKFSRRPDNSGDDLRHFNAAGRRRETQVSPRLGFILLFQITITPDF